VGEGEDVPVFRSREEDVVTRRHELPPPPSFVPEKLLEVVEASLEPTPRFCRASRARSSGQIALKLREPAATAPRRPPC